MSETQVVEGVTLDGAVEVKKEPPKEKEIPDLGKKPPKEGLCKRCGQMKPVNRLMLCYPCWVKTRLEEKGWREGQPHPADCGCGLDCALDKPSWGN